MVVFALEQDSEKLWCQVLLFCCWMVGRSRDFQKRDQDRQDCGGMMTLRGLEQRLFTNIFANILLFCYLLVVEYSGSLINVY